MRPASVPDESLLIARKVDGVVPEVGIRLPSAAHGGLHRAEGLDGGIVENNDAGHGIRAVHQRGGSFHDFYGMNAFAIHFHTMLIAPLLAFLADAVVDHQYAVVSQSADDWLGDAASRSDLGYARLTGNGVNDV